MTDITVIEHSDFSPSHFLGCIGYEKRSCYFLGNHMSSMVCESIVFDYATEGIHSYDENLELASSVATCVIRDFDDFIEKLKSIVSCNETEFCSLQIDITSFDRSKVGRIVSTIFEFSEKINSVSFVYCPSVYNEPKLSFDVVNSFGPVLPVFMGADTAPDDKLTLIAGVGFEFGRIIGAIDTLEPQYIHCFIPTGTDSRYDVSLDKANMDFSFLGDFDSKIYYNLGDTYSLYYDLRRVVEFESSKSRVMVLPLGPKIFAAISMVIAMILHPKISVWRHSTANPKRPGSIIDVEASGKVIKFSFNFS